MHRVSLQLAEWLNAGLAFFYPEICQLCGNQRARPSDGYICGTCRGKVHWIERPFCERCGRPVEGAISAAFECGTCLDDPPNFTWARAAATTDGPVLEAIHKYKYHHGLWAEPFLAGLLLERSVEELKGDSWDWFVPVPLYPTRQRAREFNQAERLARRLAAATGVPVNTHLIQRLRDTQTQTRLSREERRENVLHAFGLRKRVRLNGERILLIDDVFTTGATTDACARVLRRGGAGDVCVWTVARGV